MSDIVHSNDEEERSKAEGEEENPIDLCYCPKSPEGCITVIEKLWRSLELQVEENCVKGKWYAEIYRDKKQKISIFVRSHFLQDADSPRCVLELYCLQREVRSSDTILQAHPYVQCSIYTFPIHELIYGLLKVDYVSNSKFNVSECNNIQKLFEVVKKSSRK